MTSRWQSMRTPYPFAVVMVLGIGGCATAPPAQEGDIYSRLTGHWDEVDEQSCVTDHKVTFDDSRSTMLVSYSQAGWATPNDERKAFRYTVLAASRDSLRVALEDESRLDAMGRPVVWHIVLVDDETYCWGRDDWEPQECTPPRIRCGH